MLVDLNLFSIWVLLRKFFGKASVLKSGFLFFLFIFVFFLVLCVNQRVMKSMNPIICCIRKYTFHLVHWIDVCHISGNIPLNCDDCGLLSEAYLHLVNR